MNSPRHLRFHGDRRSHLLAPPHAPTINVLTVYLFIKYPKVPVGKHINIKADANVTSAISVLQNFIFSNLAKFVIFL